jgi:threonine dehydrogenase-like Zn-dependent dehydrogenase
MPKGVQFIRSVPRWLLVRALSGRYPSIASGACSCLRFAELPPPELPTAEWVRIKPRLAGICGSDLSAIACKGSPYFSPFVSTPFVLGHELVGDIIETGNGVPKPWKIGQRVVLEPALCCEVRGIRPPCRSCAAGAYAHCENILSGSIKGGIQTGYCARTGGAWSEATLVAHHSQLHAVPETLSDDEAVLAEPLACAVHAALKAPREKEATLLVIGCGPIGLMTIFAYRAAGGQGKVLASARCPHQIEMAGKLGANEIFRGGKCEQFYQWVLERTSPSPLAGEGRRERSERGVRGIHRPEIGKPIVLGGADCVIDCVASSGSIDDAMRLTRPLGQLILAGMPGIPKGIDWTSVWYKELRVHGSYAYGWEEFKVQSSKLTTRRASRRWRWRSNSSRRATAR